MPLPSVWLLAFVLTVAIELPCYALVLRRRLPRWQQLLALVLGLEIITHPASWWAWGELVPIVPDETVRLLSIEAAVTVVEALLVAAVLRRNSDSRRALVLGVGSSLLANSVSTAAGLVLRPLLVATSLYSVRLAFALLSVAFASLWVRTKQPPT